MSWVGLGNGELEEVCTGFLGFHSPILDSENGPALLGQRGHFSNKIIR